MYYSVSPLPHPRLGHACGLHFNFLHPSFIFQTTYEWTLGSSIQFEGRYAIADSLIHSLALTMRSAFENREFTDYLYIDSLVNVLAMYLLKAHSDCHTVAQKTPRPQRWLRQTLDYIHDSLGQDLRLSTLAHIAQMSESSFCHLFKEQMGISPHQYVIRQRIEKARLLLIEKSYRLWRLLMTVASIARVTLPFIFGSIWASLPKPIRIATKSRSGRETVVPVSEQMGE